MGNEQQNTKSKLHFLDSLLVMVDLAFVENLFACIAYILYDICRDILVTNQFLCEIWNWKMVLFES